MPPQAKPPRLSVNKLGEYLDAGPARRRRIIYDAKFPNDAIRPFYTPAEEAIAQFIAGGMHDASILENRIKTLGQSHAETVWEQRRTIGNIDAIESFMNMLDAIDLQGATPSLGAHSAPLVTFSGVNVSVRPEVSLKLTGTKGQAVSGAIKLHFPKTNPLSAAAAGYVSAVVYSYAVDHLASVGIADPRHCMVIDVASGQVSPGSPSTKQRLKNVQAACAEIAALWPTVT